MRFANRRLAPALLALTAAAEPPPPTIQFTAPVEHRLIEGIATDGRRIWLSSVLDRMILEREGGRFRTIPLPAGVANPLGIAWDAQRRWLWIATDCPGLPGIVRCERGALVAIDREGTLRAQAIAEAPFHPGDVSVRGGRVFVSDSQSGAVFVWNPVAATLDPVVPLGVGRSAQGSVQIGDRLFVADYRYGIARVDLHTGARALLPLPDGKPLNGVDGLVRAGAWLVGVRNGAGVPAVVAFKVYDGHLTKMRLLAAGGLLKDPTQIAVSADRLLLVGEAGWDAAAAGSPRADCAPILALPLPR